MVCTSMTQSTEDDDLLVSLSIGAVAAMQDAIILVNCIYDIEKVTHKNIQSALANYRSQRYEHAKSQVNMSTMLGNMLYGQVRKLIRRWDVCHIPFFFLGL